LAIYALHVALYPTHVRRGVELSVGPPECRPEGGSPSARTPPGFRTWAGSRARESFPSRPGRPAPAATAAAAASRPGSPRRRCHLPATPLSVSEWAHTRRRQRGTLVEGPGPQAVIGGGGGRRSEDRAVVDQGGGGDAEGEGRLVAADAFDARHDQRTGVQHHR